MGYKKFGSTSSETLPVGSLVPTVLKINYPTKPNWVNLSITNQLLDTTAYPSFVGITEGVLVADVLPSTPATGNNLQTLLDADSKTIGMAVKRTNYFWVLGVSASGTEQCMYRSADGLTWTKVGNLSPITSTAYIGNIYEYNGKVYVVNYGNGIYESTDSTGTTFVRKTSTQTYHVMSYNAGLFVIGSEIDGKIYTTTDHVTYTLRYTSSITGSNVYASKPLWVPSLSKWCTASCDNAGGVAKFASSSDGISGWSEVSIGTFASGNNNIELNFLDGKLMACGANGSNRFYSSNGGSSWTFFAINISSWSTYNYNGETNSVVAGDGYYYPQSTGSAKFINTVTPTPSERAVSNLGGSTQLGKFFDGTYVYCLNQNASNQLGVIRLTYAPTLGKVILPDSDNMMRVY